MVGGGKGSRAVPELNTTNIISYIYICVCIYIYIDVMCFDYVYQGSAD